MERLISEGRLAGELGGKSREMRLLMPQKGTEVFERVTVGGRFDPDGGQGLTAARPGHASWEQLQK